MRTIAESFAVAAVAPAPVRRAGATLAALVGAAALLAGCASGNPPTEQMAFANAAVTDATRNGGPEYSAAETRDAQIKYDRAKQAMAREDYDTARTLAEEAEVDAKLALTRSRSAKSQQAVAEVQNGIRVLREEIDRRAPSR